MHRNIAQLSFSMVKSKRFVLTKHFDGEAKESDLQLVEEDLPPLKDRGNFSVEFAVMFLVTGSLEVLWNSH
jgi:hypothetical protein